MLILRVRTHVICMLRLTGCLCGLGIVAKQIVRVRHLLLDPIPLGLENAPGEPLRIVNHHAICHRCHPVRLAACPASKFQAEDRF